MYKCSACGADHAANYGTDAEPTCPRCFREGRKYAANTIAIGESINPETSNKQTHTDTTLQPFFTASKKVATVIFSIAFICIAAAAAYTYYKFEREYFVISKLINEEDVYFEFVNHREEYAEEGLRVNVADRWVSPKWHYGMFDIDTSLSAEDFYSKGNGYWEFPLVDCDCGSTSELYFPIEVTKTEAAEQATYFQKAYLGKLARNKEEVAYKAMIFFAWYFVGILVSASGLYGIYLFILRAEKIRVQSEKRCPQCAEVVRVEALVCRFCGHKF